MAGTNLRARVQYRHRRAPLRDVWLQNKDSMIHYIDLLIESLREVRGVLAAEDRNALEAVVTQAADDYSAWINRRHNNKWDDSPKDRNTPSTSESLMTGLMGGFLTRKLRGDSEKN